MGALLAMEKLITGTPQRIQDGAILLGLSSWHLYPDMIVLGNVVKQIKQGDPLINPGGIITMGLQSKPEDTDDGVYWSLPLAHVRYYGDAVMATRHTGIGESRVPFDEFMFVVLGSVLSTWNVVGMPLDACLDLIQKLAGPASGGYFNADCLQSLATAAAQLKKLNGTSHQQAMRLVSFGQRRCAGFLAPVDSHPPAVFGLTDLETLLDTFGNNTSGKVALLRSWASRALAGTPQLEDALIRYRDSSYAKFRLTSVSGSRIRITGKKRRRSAQADEAVMSSPMYTVWMDENSEVENRDDENPADVNSRNDELRNRRRRIALSPRPGEEAKSYMFMYGDVDKAAIFMPSHRAARWRDIKREMSTTDLAACIDDRYVTASQLVDRILDPLHQGKHDLYFESLRAIKQAERIYSDLPGARVELQVTSRPLALSKWWQGTIHSETGLEDRSLSRIFSCISLFETGLLDVDPGTIGENVIAVSHTNSIFVASALLMDPAAAVPVVPVERIIGNVGKPGLAFLISPPDPKMRKIDYASWNLVAHETFDGKPQDNFRGTSLHLSFTGYELPLDIGTRGARDQPAAFVETVVSVYDRGEWVADLDIMKSCKSWASQSQKQRCQHATNEKVDMSSWMPLVAIDSWLEFLDHPIENCVVRARGNTMARLAAAALAAQQSREVLIVPIEECWKCLKQDLSCSTTHEQKKNNLENGDGSESLSDTESESYGDDDMGGTLDSEVFAFDLKPPSEVVDAKAGLTFIY